MPRAAGVRQALSLPSSPRTDERTEIRHGREAVRALRLAEAVVALANKNARILWALMTRGEAGYARLAWQGADYMMPSQESPPRPHSREE